MKAPISWLKEYTNLKTPTKELIWKMTEAGLTTESFEKLNGNIVLDVEVTPNRPDWLSMVGIAREISVIQNTKLNIPDLPEISRPTKKLPISVSIAPKLAGRYSGVTIANIKVKNSPAWMQKRLKLVGLRPINNLVDITNYVMFEFGIPIHVFDYDKFLSHKLTVELSRGGEKFISVDGISYKLPKNATIIKDKDRVVDLAAIKGGKNTGIDNGTENIFIHIPIYDPVITRRTSQKMKLASDASYIYERGPDLGGTLNSLKRTVDLTLKLAGGEIASKVIDIKSKEYKPKKLSLSFENLTSTLGVDVPKKKVVNILKRLDLSPATKGGEIECTIPTYRGDLNIKEDLIEEIARIYQYNKLPKTLPTGTTSKVKIPYNYNRSFELRLKNQMSAAGFTEVNTLALTSKDVIKKCQLNLDNHIKIANPVSLECEYFRTSLLPNLLLASKINPDENSVRLFEYNKVYFAPVDKAKEPYKLSSVIINGSYKDIKGSLDLIFTRLNIQRATDIKAYTLTRGLWHPARSGVIEIGNDMIGIVGEVNPTVLANFNIKDKPMAFELDIETLAKYSQDITFAPPNKYPAQVEDITLVLPKRTKVGKLILAIKSSNKLITTVELIDSFNDSHTFRVWYQHPKKTLTDKEVEAIRKKLLAQLKKRYKISLKE